MTKRYDKELRAAQIARLKDKDIDYSDIPDLDEKFWAKAKIVEARSKQAVTIRYDREVIEWFKAHGKGYQTRMNAVLLAYVNSQQSDNKS